MPTADQDTIHLHVRDAVLKACLSAQRESVHFLPPKLRREQLLISAVNVDGLDVSALTSLLPSSCRVFVRSPAVTNELESRIDIYVCLARRVPSPLWGAIFFATRWSALLWTATGAVASWRFWVC